MTDLKRIIYSNQYKKRQSLSGFTLMEVMVALSIIAIAMSAIISVSSSHTNNASYLRDKTFSYWIASDLITEIQIKHEWPPTGITTGEANQLGQDWQWQMEIKQTPDESVNVIKVKAGLADRDGYSATVTGYLAHFKD
jgi:general secretion pathway protein I